MTDNPQQYDLAVIGGGPAGVAAGVYASRKKLKTIFITKDFQGQSAVSEGIENWIGTVKISGTDLSKALENHLRAYAGDVVKISEGELCQDITKSGTLFSVKTNNATYQTKTVLVTTGSSRRKLDVEGAAKLEHKGITYCATCDGPIFSGQNVAVIGGGNAAFETAAQLLAYCPSVTLINRSDTFKADPITVEKVLAHPNMRVIKNAALVKILGDKFLTGLIYKESAGPDTTLPVTGIFVEIGSVPNTGFLKNVVTLDKWNRIVVDPKNQRASVAGIWAAGDCSDGLYHQNNIAAGDGVKALEDIYLYIHAK
jgi:alkyl hydroperoxide reductase subunit F